MKREKSWFHTLGRDFNLKLDMATLDHELNEWFVKNGLVIEKPQRFTTEIRYKCMN